MQFIDFSRGRSTPITLFDAVGAANVHLGSGHGETHVYCVHFDAGGLIGAHPAGFGQLFLIVQGSGWVAGADAVRVPLTSGQGAFFAPGETHSKGTDTGMTVVMIQADTLTPVA